jgi:hypothetical protein
MSFVECLLFRPDHLPIASKFIRNERLTEIKEKIENRKLKLQKEYNTKTPNNLKDFLYWRHREARLLSNMAYYRRRYVKHIAPFLFQNTINAISNIRHTDRVRKRHFTTMAENKFPSLFADKYQATSYKSKVNRFELLFSKEWFFDFAKSKLIDSPPDTFLRVVDTPALSSSMENFRKHDYYSTNKNQYNYKRFLNNILRKWPALSGLVKYSANQIGMFNFPVVESTYLFRLLSLSITLSKYENSSS